MSETIDGNREIFNSVRAIVDARIAARCEDEERKRVRRAPESFSCCEPIVPLESANGASRRPRARIPFGLKHIGWPRSHRVDFLY